MADSAGSRYVRRSRAGAATATPGVPAIAAAVPADNPVSLKAATRRSARPTRSRTVVLTEVSTPAFVASPANRTATPRATPRMLNPTRAGRARRLRKARVVSDIG